VNDKSPFLVRSTVPAEIRDLPLTVAKAIASRLPCPHCGKTISLGEPTIFLEGKHYHAKCPTKREPKRVQAKLP